MPHRSIIVFVLMGFGCASTPSTSATSQRAFQEVAAKPRPLSDESESALVSVAKDIREACGIEDSRAFFSYNSAQVTQQDTSFFQKLAVCFAEGPMRGRALRLVGRADARGDTDYNYLLGQRRADGVRAAVVAAGLGSDKVSSTSRGELEAHGEDEAGWAEDRRVDVVLGGS